MTLLANWSSAARKIQWSRGLRAGLAVLVASLVCHMLNQPIGWAALGGFEAILVDNGGPYWSRLLTMGTLMLGGAAACIVASLAATPLAIALLVTAAFCFATTYARVIAQPIASTSVIILVIYFAGFGGASHSLHGALIEAFQFALGCAWAALLSLILWPLDPFRPARLQVAACYDTLASFTAQVKATAPKSDQREAERARIHQLQRTMRLKMEEARAALEATAARTASRTVRARSLTVLLETADMLFAETIRWTEFVENTEDDPSRLALLDALRWLSGAERAIAEGLRERPADGAASFTPEGSHSLEYLLGREQEIAKRKLTDSPLIAHFAADESDAMQSIQIAFEAVHALWSGLDMRTGDVAKRWSVLADHGLAERQLAAGAAMSWTEIIRANWTGQSLMMRHALRLAAVGAIDITIMWSMHLFHASWLGMTSVIVLQPYGSGTYRKSLQRVGGTIAGGVLAAVLAASIHSQMGIVIVLTATSVLTLATFAVNYAWYSFFLTPTFVLMSLPHLRDWHFAGVRIEMTVIGALVAVVAMRLLWPEEEKIELGRLLGQAAAADSAYVAAMLRFWKAPPEERQAAERQVLAPARRRSGLAVIDAQETLDRLLLEPDLSWRRQDKSGSEWESALTFVTYLQRFARAVTALAIVGTTNESAVHRVEVVIRRLDELSRSMVANETVKPTDTMLPPASVLYTESNIAEQQLRRIERQVSVMERAAASLQQQHRLESS
jgi:uncharacterized membrane protein YccC